MSAFSESVGPGLPKVEPGAMTSQQSHSPSATIEFSARGRLDELRETLARNVKSLAATLMKRAGCPSLTTDYIDKAWDAIVYEKTAGCDISAARIAAPAHIVDDSAIARICDLKWELGLLVERRAMETAAADGRLSAVVRVEDIDNAWDATTYGNNPALKASNLVPKRPEAIRGDA